MAMTSLVCTRFPNLSSFAKVPNLPVSRQISNLDTSGKTLCLAWAQVLKAYSGEEHEVLFFSDQEIISVDVASWSLQHLDLPNEDGRSSRSDQTGIFLKKATEFRELALELHYDVETEAGQLHSQGYVPHEHMEQIETQLREAIARLGEPGAVQSIPTQRLSIVNYPPSHLPGGQLLHELIQDTSNEEPFAIEFWGSDRIIKHLTYHELHKKSTRLAAKLRSSVRSFASSKQPIIPLFIPQSAELYVAMLAVLKAGFAFCPLQLDAPPERLRFVFNDISACLIITTTAQKIRLPETFIDILSISVDDEGDDVSTPDPFESFQIHHTDNAYIMYTSGSTGQPKGVPISHQAATQSLMAHEKYIPTFSRFLQFAAPTFDVSIFEIFFTLSRGSTLVGCDREILLADLPAAMRRMNVDAAELTPTVASGLLRQRSNVPSLQLLLTIGEMLTPSVIEEFGSNPLQKTILWAMYGPTEAAIHCTVLPAFMSTLRPTNIGIPFPTVSAFIAALALNKTVDQERLTVLPLGHVGELVLGGYQLAGGYLNRPEQTSKAFIDNQKYGRLYRTGDKARILPDMSIECLGRISSGQIKLRGQRLELGEVQYAATRAAGCRDAVVSLVMGTLVAFCLTVGEEITAQDVINACRQWLPAFMVPGDVVLCSQYPFLPSGKVDKAKLEREYSLQRQSVPQIAGNSPEKKIGQICDILSKALGCVVHPTASLSASGLDSLSAILAVSALRKSGFSLSPTDLLGATTASDLLSLLSRKQQGGLKVGSSLAEVEDMSAKIQSLALKNPLVRGLEQEISRMYSCTALQISMLVETAKDPSAYCNTLKFRLPFECKTSDIKDHIRALAMNNEILRSGFCRLPSSSHPFALIVWRELQEDQIYMTEGTEHRFCITNEDSLLRPIHFQISTSRGMVNKSSLLSIQLHHALYDGWSEDLLLKDLDDLIHRRQPDLRSQFREVIQYYYKVDESSSLRYWQDQLRNYHPSSLPNYNGRQLEDAESRVESQKFEFDICYQKLRTCAIAHDLTPQAFFQGALAYILSHYFGTPDITMGVVTSGRTIPIPGIETIIGPCVTTLPLRLNVAHSKRIIDMLRVIHTRNRQMLHQGDASIRSIKKAAGLRATEALWNVLFVWQETLQRREQLIRSVEMIESSNNLESPLTFEVEPRGEKLYGLVTYHTTNFPNAQIVLLLEQINVLVCLFEESLHLPIADLDSKFPAPVLSIANHVPEFPIFKNGLADSVENFSRIHPNTIALQFLPSSHVESAETLTYEQLNTRANKLAHLLLRHLETSMELIGVCMEKSLDLYVGILAILKTGRGYLPLIPTTPIERAKLILKQSNVKICISSSQIDSALHLAHSCTVLTFDQAVLSRCCSENPCIVYDGSRIAYAIFTSGSTGTPKGVLVTQQNLKSNLKVLSEIYPASSDDKLLQACSQAFDVSAFEIFFAWSVGMCLCSATNDILFADIERNIRILEVTHLSLTPTVAALVRPENVPSVRFLVTAGEAVTEKVRSMWAGKGLYQGYGPSETTNICTVKANLSDLDSINNIGPPLANTSAFIINPRSGVILPSGALGELCFGGDQVFKGYLNDLELTAARVFKHETYGRLYKTGDTGRLLPNGSILFAARLDDQVKLRGQRIELEEINQCILKMDLALNCQTSVIEDEHGKSTQLVTFWLPKISTNVEASVLPITKEIRAIIDMVYERLTEALPSYMIPVALIPITAIPRTNQGKIDKRNLLSLHGSLDINILEASGRKFDDDEENEQNEWTKLEKAIAQAVSRTAHVPIGQVKRQTSFFSLGMDSISAIILSKDLQDMGQPPLSVSTILLNPTVARLARVRPSVNESTRSSSDISRLLKTDYTQSKILEAGVDPSIRILPCTPLQEAMLSTSSNNSSNLYCNTIILRIQGDFKQLQECWAFMVARHEILRTVFVTTENLEFPFGQLVLPEHHLEWIAKRAPTHSRFREIAKSYVADNIPPPVDSFEPPYILATIECGDSTYLQFSCHHALYDGAAIENLLREIERHSLGQRLPKAISFEPFLQEMVKQRSPESVSFWTKQLEDFEPTLLVTKSREHSSFSTKVDFPLSRLEKSCRQLGFSLLTLSQVTWAKVLLDLFCEPDVCFGNVVGGRTLSLENIGQLVAPTFNTLPMRMNTNQLRSNTELLVHAQQSNAKALSCQLTPLRSIQQQLGFGGCGLFSTLLLFQQSPLELNAELWTLEEEFGDMDFPIILELVPNVVANTLVLTLYYELSILSPEQPNEICQAVTRAMESCIKYPEGSATDFVGVSDQLRKEVLEKSARPKASLLSSSDSQQIISPSPPETFLHRILSEFTQISTVGLDSQTTIHQIGLDSISAIQLASRIRSLKNIKIFAADIMERPVITDLATWIQRQEVSKTGEELPKFNLDKFHREHIQQICEETGVSTDQIQSVRPCTALQNGLISQFLTSETLYVNHVTYEMDGAWTASSLYDAWVSATNSFGILRAGFVPVSDTILPFAMVTYVESYIPPPLEVVSDLPSIEDWRKQRVRQFHNRMDQPTWAVLIEESPRKLLMHITIFHGLYDAHSLSLIIQSLGSVPNNGPQSQTTVVDAVLAEILTSSISVERAQTGDGVKYWKSLLENTPINPFPNLAPLHYSTGTTITCSRTCSKSFSELEFSCQQGGFTIQAAGQAAWARLLSAYIGEPSVAFGVVLSGRDTIMDAEKAVFPCITIVPVTATDSGDNWKLLTSMMNFNSSIRKYQFTPTKDIQKWTGRRNQPLYDTIFAFQRFAELEQPQKNKVVNEIATAEYVISIELEPRSDDALLLRATFQVDLIPEQQASILLDQFNALLIEILASPRAHGISNDLLHGADHLLSIIPAKQPILLSPVTMLHQFVEVGAENHPGRIAFEFASQIKNDEVVSKVWTYKELDEEGNRIAHLLRQRGISDGNLVAICFEKCPEASFAILGILKAGCGYVAIDPGAPLARKVFILEDSRAVLVLASGEGATRFSNSSNKALGESDEAHRLASNGIPIVCLVGDYRHGLSPKRVSLRGEQSPSATCYCLYTSGTTGTPKGCEISHENAVQAMRAFSILFANRWNVNSRWLQFASFHFDVSVLEQYWSWSEGIRVVSAPRDLIFEDIAATVRALKITHIDLTPSLALLLNPDDVPSLCEGVFITGGEQLKQEILDVWGPFKVIHNGYGPTEATIGVTMFTGVPENGKPANIGRQFENVGTYVLKPNGSEPVLRGGIGELCVSGKLVGRGYLNRPELTAEKFPTLEKFGDRIYRTGDLVRLLWDGSFMFLGRADDQVKLRGQRLEIGEINSVIRYAVQDVSDISTHILKHPKQQRDQLVCFFATSYSNKESQLVTVVQSQKSVSTIRKVRNACQASLPSYMVPTYFIPLTRMPLSANNKTDGHALKQLFNESSSDLLQRLSGEDEKHLDLFPVERKVASILSELISIDVKDIHKNSNFMELGLDSISAIGFSRALKSAGFTNARPALVLTHGTLKSLAEAINGQRESVHTNAPILDAQQSIAMCFRQNRARVARILGEDLNHITAIAPCTALQEGMISRSTSDDEMAYFGSFHYHLEDHVEISRLCNAWSRAVREIQILRTRFLQTDDGYVQVVLGQVQLPWREITISQQSEFDDLAVNQRREWRQKNASELSTPFEIAIVRGPVQSFMILNIFHALYDGNSLLLLLSLVRMFYEDHKAINVGPDFQEALAYGPLCRMKGAREFWTRHINVERIQAFPSLVQDGQSGVSTSRATFNNVSGLETVRKKLNVTHQAIIQACLVAVLQQFYSQPTPFGLITSGRTIDLDGADRVVGPLFNTIPFLIPTDARDTWKTMIKKCHQFNVDAMPYQHTPLRQVQKWCRLSSERQLFDVLIVFQKETAETCDSESNDLWRFIGDQSAADYPLAVEVALKMDGSVVITLVAQGHIADSAALDELAERIHRALIKLIENPNDRVSATIGLTAVNGTNAVADVLEDAEASESSTKFEWTNHAITLRREIASLALMDEKTVSDTISIFECGLDSIDAIKLSSRLRRSGLNLPVSTIMRYPAIGQMIHALGDAEDTLSKHDATDPFEMPLRRYFEDEEMSMIDASVLPATPLQEAMVVEMFSSNYERYYNHDILKISTGVDTETLKRAWRRIFDGNDILRTCFYEVNDPSLPFSFAQVVPKKSEMFWQEVSSLQRTDMSQILKSIKETAALEQQTGNHFKLTFIHASTEKFLVISLPHALYDGWSLTLLHHDVQEAYHDRDTPRPSHRKILQDIIRGSNEEASVFWSDYLSEAKPCRLTTSPQGPTKSIPTVHRKERVSEVKLSSLRSFCRIHGITMQALGQTSWSLVLASCTKSLEIIYGVILSGRDTENSQKIMFPTMNTVAFRHFLHGTRKDLLRYAHDSMASIRKFQHYPLRKAQSAADVGGKRLFDSLFLYQIRPDIGAQSESPLYTSIGGSSDVEYPVCVEMEVLGESLIWRVACEEWAFNAHATSELLNHLDSTLVSLMKDVDESILAFEGNKVRIGDLPPFVFEHGSMPVEEVKPSTEEFEDAVALSSTEQKIRAVLSAVSGIPEKDIDRRSTLPHLGLDSISAIKVSGLLRKESVVLRVGDMLKASTVAGMARHVDSETAGLSQVGFQKDPDLIDIPVNYNMLEILQTSGLKSAGFDTEHVENMIPASAGQVYMLTTWEKSGGRLFYGEFKISIIPSASAQNIHEGWRRLIARNPILRTFFVATGDVEQPYIQLIAKMGIMTSIVAQHPRDTSQPNSGILAARDLLDLECAESLHLKQPFVELSYNREGGKHWELSLRIHHALYDGVSLPVLLSELRQSIEQSGQDGYPATIPSVHVSRSKAFDGFCTQSYHARHSDRARRFWIQYLEGAGKYVSNVNLSTSKEPQQRFSKYRPRHITRGDKLISLARHHGLSLPSIFLAIYARLYSKFKISHLAGYSDQADSIIIGIYMANRHNATGDLSTAPTVNLLPLRVNLAVPILQSAGQIQDDLAEISDVQHVSVGLWQIADWTGIKVDTFVNYLKLPGESDDFRRDVSNRATNLIGEKASSTEDSDGLIDSSQARFVVPIELSNVAVREAYVPSIDIEVALRDEHLDVGIFGPIACMSEHDADMMLQNLRDEFVALLKQEEVKA